MTASANRWRSQDGSRASPVMPTSRQPSCLMKRLVAGPQVPLVSKATGCTWNWPVSPAYFRTFLSSASLAAAPATVAVAGRWEGAKVLTQVASHTNDFPSVNGNSVSPSGRLPSPRSMPVGSKRDGTPTACRVRLTTSLCLRPQPTYKICNTGHRLLSSLR